MKMIRTMSAQVGKAVTETPTLNMVVGKATHRAWEQQAGSVKEGLLRNVARDIAHELTLEWVKEKGGNILEGMQTKSVADAVSGAFATEQKIVAEMAKRRDNLVNAINTTGLKLVTSIADQLKTEAGELKNSLGRKF